MNYYESAQRAIDFWESRGISTESDLISGILEYKVDIYRKGPTYLKTNEYKLVQDGLLFQGIKRLSKVNPTEARRFMAKS